MTSQSLFLARPLHYQDTLSGRSQNQQRCRDGHCHRNLLLPYGILAHCLATLSGILPTRQLRSPDRSQQPHSASVRQYHHTCPGSYRLILLSGRLGSAIPQNYRSSLLLHPPRKHRGVHHQNQQYTKLNPQTHHC